MKLIGIHHTCTTDMKNGLIMLHGIGAYQDKDILVYHFQYGTVKNVVPNFSYPRSARPGPGHTDPRRTHRCGHRASSWAKDNDIHNICFICQIDADSCAIKGIDFNEHTQKIHNLWNYVYFLCYLYMKDESEYNIMEYKVMSSINELNLAWLPIGGNSNDDA